MSNVKDRNVSAKNENTISMQDDRSSNCKDGDKRKRNRRNGKNRRPKDETQQFNGKQKAPVRNNASLYFGNPILAEQVSDFSFNQFMGSTDNLGPIKTSSVPTIATYWLNPCPGYSIGDVHTGINVAGLKIFTTLSANNAKTTNYAPQDVTTLILAMGEIISLTEVIKRAMGVAYTYNIRNRSLPLQVVNAMGINSNFITSGDLARLRVRLNTALNRANSIPFFSNIPYLRKCENLYKVYYTDSESPMAQIIIPMPATTWVVNETKSDKGTVLETRGVSIFDNSMTPKSNNASMDNIIDLLNEMITQLMTSATFNYIYSDMLRVFGESSTFYKFELMPEGYSVFPEFNPMFCLQMHNATAVGKPKVGTGSEEETPYNDVYPNPDLLGLRWNPQFMDSVAPDSETYTRLHTFALPQLLDFPHSMGNPDVDQRVDATRYKVMFKLNGTIVEDATFPDHYLSFVSYLYPGKTKLDAFYVSVWDDQNVTGEAAKELAATKSKFDYDILTYAVKRITGGTVPNYDIIGDIDFWTLVDYQYLKGVNDLCAAGLYELREVKS